MAAARWIWSLGKKPILLGLTGLSFDVGNRLVVSNLITIDLVAPGNTTPGITVPERVKTELLTAGVKVLNLSLSSNHKPDEVHYAESIVQVGFKAAVRRLVATGPVTKNYNLSSSVIDGDTGPVGFDQYSTMNLEAITLEPPDFNLIPRFVHSSKAAMSESLPLSGEVKIEFSIEVPRR